MSFHFDVKTFRQVEDLFKPLAGLEWPQVEKEICNPVSPSQPPVLLVTIEAIEEAFLSARKRKVSAYNDAVGQ
jgi:hypothetical protein